MESMGLGFTKIFKGKKVFITGHTGFKGSWLIQWLHLLGAEIKGYALAPENSFDLYHIIEGDKLCQSVIADIRDDALLKKELLSFEPDFIFHMAAQPLVRYSYLHPLETFSVNTLGTANLLDALKDLKKACTVVCITTDKVYHNEENGHYYTEDDKLGDKDPYSASKAAAEIIISSYQHSFFNAELFPVHQKSISVARAGNVIGGGDWSKDRIIPDIISSLQKEKPVVVRNPTAIRPWQHVLEPLCGYLTLAAAQAREPLKFSGAYNFGPAAVEEFTVEQVVKKAIAVWGSGSSMVSNIMLPGIQPHEAGLLHLSIEKAKSELGWMPLFSPGEAIEQTICWYKSWASDPGEGKNSIINSIHHYMNLLHEVS